MTGVPSPEAPPPDDRPGRPWPDEAPWAAPGGRPDAAPWAAPGGQPAGADRAGGSASAGGTGLPEASGWPGRAPGPSAAPAARSAPPGAPSAGEGIRNDPVSVAALVTGVLPTGPVAVVLGVLGVRRTGRGRRPGRGFAVTGLVLGCAWTVVAVAAGVSLLRGPGLEGDVTEPVGRASAQLREGNCVRNLPPDGEVRRVSLVPCAEPHTAQVFHVGELSAEPGNVEDAYGAGRQVCTDAADAAGIGGDVEIVTLVPTSGTSPVVCLAEWPTPVPTDLVN